MGLKGNRPRVTWLETGWARTETQVFGLIILEAGSVESLILKCLPQK